jgi:hypothetical protein
VVVTVPIASSVAVLDLEGEKGALSINKRVRDEGFMHCGAFVCVGIVFCLQKPC